MGYLDQVTEKLDESRNIGVCYIDFNEGDIFVAKLERSTLSQAIGGLAHYSRYMDDIFCVTNREHNIQQILKLFNEAHPSLEFTVEVEANNNLAFLDVAVSRKEDGSVRRHSQKEDMEWPIY
ncbi:unnamed protein product [Echinostoma caproni]|uniref:Reverse transcriptase domain-containing protein n=1 Tax=Echinostoma caproni TaxID=27848 RepID=A0A183ALH8_9TREM|nr:unnamed protein product [Echinostoma caproni]